MKMRIIGTLITILGLSVSWGANGFMSAVCI